MDRPRDRRHDSRPTPRRHHDQRSRSPNTTRRRSHSRSPRAHHPLSPPPRTRPNRRACWYAQDYDPIQVGSIDGTGTIPHDKALTRALHARFDASRDSQIQGNPLTTLFVGRLNYKTTEATLRAVFGAFGPIVRVRLVRDVITQHSKGYGFIEYADDHAFRTAYQRGHRMEIDGRMVLVDYERSRVMRGWKPRRLGGGLGGRKESGQLRFGGREHPFKPSRA